MKITQLTKYTHVTHAEADAAVAAHGRFFRCAVVPRVDSGPAWRLTCDEKTWPNNENPRWVTRITVDGDNESALEQTGRIWVQEQCLAAGRVGEPLCP